MAKLTQKIIGLIMPAMEKLTPPCEIISQKISRSLDGEISLRDRIEIRIHTMGCALCKRYRQQLLAMRQMLEKYAAENGAADPEQKNRLSEEARNRIVQVIRQEKEK